MAELAVAHTLINGQRPAAAAGVVAAALPLAVRSANPTALTWAHYLAGEVAAEADPHRAATEYRAAVEHGLQADSRLFVTMARSSAAALAARTGSVGQALAAFPEVLAQWVQLGNAAAQGWTLQQVVVLLVRSGAHADAAVLAGAVLAGGEHVVSFPADAQRLSAALDTARERLGGPAYTDAFNSGATLFPTATVAHAQRALARAASLPKPTAASSARPAPA